MTETRPPIIDVHSPHGQRMIVLLATLRQLGGIRTKQDIVAHIQKLRWIDIQREDWTPYKTQTEPRWHTDIAYARKDCVIRQMMFDHDEKDFWEATRKGLDALVTFESHFAGGQHCDVRRCYLWTPQFKLIMCPRYAPSDEDAIRRRKLSGLDLVEVT